MRSPAPALLLFIGCVLASLDGCTEPGTITSFSGTAIPAAPSARAGSGPRRLSASEVRLGHGLDVDGKVPPSFGANRFATRDPIYLSMEMSATAAAVIRIRVRNTVTDQMILGEEKEAQPGESYLSFLIGRGLAGGSYRVDVILDDEVVSQKGFDVF
jgi:hypothetical protein